MDFSCDRILNYNLQRSDLHVENLQQQLNYQLSKSNLHLIDFVTSFIVSFTFLHLKKKLCFQIRTLLFFESNIAQKSDRSKQKKEPALPKGLSEDLIKKSF